MTRDVVEVVTRFGDTILDVVHVGAHQSYRIGTARDVQAAVPGLTSFPLVDRGVVRWPLGVPAQQHASSTELQFAGVTLVVTRCKLPRERVRRPRIQRRAAAFTIGSLLVHLAMWFVAVTLEPFEALAREARPRMRYVQIDTSRDPEPAPKPEPANAEQRTQDTAPRAPAPARRTQREASQTTVVDTFAGAASDVAAMVANTKVLERVGALKAEDNFTADDTYTSGFGGSRRMGSGETIKTGEGYSLMLRNDVKLCPKRSCTVRGPVPASFVRAQLHEIMGEIYGCYEKHADATGTITLEFTINGDGSVSHARGSGLGETGSCVAALLPAIYFKAIGDNDVAAGKQRHTTVRYPLQFI